MNQKKSENEGFIVEETFSLATCPKCGQKYIASDGHVCPKKK